MPANLQRLLTQLEEARQRFGAGAESDTTKLLAQVARQRFRDADSLVRFHDALLFLRAFPAGPAIVKQTEALLAGFNARIAELEKSGADMEAFEDESVSGIAGVDIVDAFSYPIAQWLASRFPQAVRIYWDAAEQTSRMANTWPRFLPLLEEDALVEADVPYQRWLREASGKSGNLAWLLQRFAQLPRSAREKAELYESLELPLEWKTGTASRTLCRKPGGQVFYHREPLIIRKQVSLEREMAAPLEFRTLSPAESEEIIDLSRQALTVRYRGLYGMTHGSGSAVVEADVGRGVKIFLWGVPPELRLPLRAYCAGFTLKNGVPINYIEAISLFEWTEVGFNTFYAFRDGETAWIYAQALRCLRQLLGVSCISVYPYQIGHGNPEALKSGAFWFYRKLGFRPGRPELVKVVELEEKKIAAKPSYRTPLSTLKKLAAEHIFYEVPGTPRAEWDRFAMRNIGFAVQRRMAQEFSGSASLMRAQSAASLAGMLGVNGEGWNEHERAAFENFALVLGVVSLEDWKAADKTALTEIIRAKMEKEEWRYLRSMQGHGRLRREMLRLGSAADSSHAKACSE